MKKKILVFINPNMISGAEVVLKEYAQRSNLDFDMLLPNRREVIDFFSGVKNITVKKVYSGEIKTLKNKAISRARNVMIMFRQAKFLSDYVRKNEIKGLYVNNTTAASVAGIACTFYGMKCNVLAHIHDMMSASSFPAFIKFFGKDFDYLAVSLKCKQELVEYCNIDKDRISVAYNGVEISERMPVREKCGTIGFAGSVTERKGLIYLARALKIVNEQGANLSLEIASNYIDRNYFSLVCENLGSVKYEIREYPHSSIRDFYRKIDLLVVPSINDPLPTSILEAMNYGIPVIGSNVDGIPEMLSSPYIFQKKDVSEMAHLVEMMVKSDAKFREGICITNHTKVERQFSIEECSKLKDKLIVHYC